MFSTRRWMTGVLVAVGVSIGPCPAPLGAQQAGQVRFELAPAGNEARYRVKEQLAGVNLPGEAVGTTSAITGVVVLTGTGAVVPGTSSFVVDITGLKSDSGAAGRVHPAEHAADSAVSEGRARDQGAAGTEVSAARVGGAEVRAGRRSDRPRRDEAFDLAGDGDAEGRRRGGHRDDVVHVRRVRVDETEGDVGPERGRHDQAGVHVPSGAEEVAGVIGIGFQNPSRVAANGTACLPGLHPAQARANPLTVIAVTYAMAPANSTLMCTGPMTRISPKMP